MENVLQTLICLNADNKDNASFFSQERCHAAKNSEEKNRQVYRKDEAKNTITK